MIDNSSGELIRPLLSSELACWCEQSLSRDFSPLEAKPLAVFKHLICSGRYAVLGWFRQEQMLGYAGVHRTGVKSTGASEIAGQKAAGILLDYLAIEPDFRNQGLGAAFMNWLSHQAGSGCLPMAPVVAGQNLEQALQAYDQDNLVFGPSGQPAWMILEVSDPEYSASPQEANLDKRRLAFYSRCGYAQTDLRVHIYGKHYILLVPDSMTAKRQLVMEHYRAILGNVVPGSEYILSVKED